MTPPADTDLYRRGVKTVLAAWEEYARGAPGAEVRHGPGFAAAIFPHEPERNVYNNAILGRDLPARGRAAAIAAMETAYDARGVTRFAAWVHEADEPLRSDLERRGYTVDETTRAMGMPLTDILMPRPALELGSAGWDDFLRIFGFPALLLSGADHSAFHLLFARLDAECVATATAFDHEGDCGIYNVATLEHARRRGLGTALTAVQLHDAAARGCRTASVQATEMAEHVYAAVGFRDLGLILEYVPPNHRHPIHP
jgi:GNAT superfamily N-acetyltransferase